MPTSGTYAFNPTFDDILQDAAGMVGGGPVLAEELMSARRGMDQLLTRIQNRNILLHKVATTTIPTSSSVGVYPVNPSVSDVLAVASRKNGIDLLLDREGLMQWAERTAKSQAGRPTTYWFDRQRDGGVLNVWPVPTSAASDSLVITFQRLPEDTTRIFDNVDVPRRFIPAVTLGLAYWIGMRRPRVDGGRLSIIKGEYEQALREALGEDRERASFRIKVSY